ELRGKRIVVLGAGRSGLAAAHLLSDHGARPFLSDRQEIPSQTKEELEALGAAYEEGGHTERILKSELIILSPGVPLDIPILRRARRRGIPIIGELELACRLCKSKKILAVTGTNGKSTTVRLIGELLNAQGHTTVVAGNIGNPLSGELARINRETIVVLEVSSFQLESVQEFRPWVSLFLNFAPDHLDRHGTMDQYFKAKCRIFQNQARDDLAIVHAKVLPLLPPLNPRVLVVNAEEGASIDLSQIDLRKALTLPHRLELVAERGGVRFYDDSKATNVAATLAAIGSFPDSKLTLILGGRAKGESFSPLAEAVKGREIEVLLLDEAAREIARELHAVGHRRFHFIRDLQEGVQMAAELKREVCLLAPACASFDSFANYAERGATFQKAVLALNRQRIDWHLQGQR
ncbi:MAG: UDP-N-acetylmuramoyl-L-alanine--D-glutamate ligase, partial [Candidatus Bipolaricaulia bacterium]